MQLPNDQLLARLIYFFQSRKSKIIVEVNKTINSMAAAVLLKKALGERAIAIVFDFDDSLAGICKDFGLNAYLLKRKAAYQKELTVYHHHKQTDIYNYYRRFINYHLQIQAETMKALICDTFDKSDRLIIKRPNGFYGSLMPFYSLFKTEVFNLAKFLGINHTFTDYDYWKKIDPILSLLTEKQIAPEQISQEFNIDLLWLKKLKSHIDKESLKTAVNQFII